MFMAFTVLTVQKLHSCCWCGIAQQIHRGDLESKLLLELVVPSSGRSRVLLSCYGVNFIMRMYRTVDVIRLDKSRDETISNLSRQVKLSNSAYDFRKFVLKNMFQASLTVCVTMIHVSMSLLKTAGISVSILSAQKISSNKATSQKRHFFDKLAEIDDQRIPLTTAVQ